MLKLQRPDKWVPDPFGAEFSKQVSGSAMLKIPRPKHDERIDPEKFKDLKKQYERADQLLTMMPPASFDGAWYGVVRVHFRTDSETVKKSGIKIGLVCKEQLINATELDSIMCWEYNGVEFRAGGDVGGMIEFLERRFAVARKEKEDGVVF